LLGDIVTGVAILHHAEHPANLSFRALQPQGDGALMGFSSASVMCNVTIFAPTARA